MKKILILSNSPYANFGYSKIARKVYEVCSQYYETYYVGMQTIGNQLEWNGIKTLPVNYDPFGSDSLENYIKALGINTLFTFVDLWTKNTDYIVNLVNKYDLYWIAHATVNCSPPPMSLLNKVRYADVVVSPSPFVKEELMKHGIYSVCIPHFYNDEFRIINKEYGNYFITVATNKGTHKNFFTLFRAYKHYLNLGGETELIVVTDPLSLEGMNLIELRDSMGLKDKVRFVRCKIKNGKQIGVLEPHGDYYLMNNYPLNDEEMCKLYNLSKLHLNVSYGESFCIPVIESMACGIPSLVPNHTAFTSFDEPCVFKCNDLIDLLNVQGLSYYQVNYKAYGEMMYKVEEEHLPYLKKENISQQAERYSWSKIKPMWESIVLSNAKKVDYYGQKYGI